MRKILFILLLLPSIVYGQSTFIYGTSGTRTTDTAKTLNTLFLPKYATPDSNKVLGLDERGIVVLRTKGTGGSADSTIFATLYRLDTAKTQIRSEIAASVSGVSSVGSGYGLLGGPITSTGTLLVDTLQITTRAWRQKGVDSLNGTIDLRVKYTDTAALVAPYLKESDTAGMLLPYLRKTDTAQMLAPYLKESDTAGMLANYMNFGDTMTLSNRIDAISSSPEPEFYGNIYSENTWTNLNDFTNNMAATVVGNKIQTGGSIGTYTQTLDYNYYTCLERWSHTQRFTVDVVNANSYGYGIGVKSTNGGTGYSAIGRLGWFTGNTSSPIWLDVQQGTWSNALTTVRTLAASAGDEILLTVSRDVDVLSVTARNLSTGLYIDTSLIYTDSTLNYATPNTGKFAGFYFGGQHTIDSIAITSTDVKNAPAIFLGDSKTVGYLSSTFYTRYANLVGQNMSAFVINAGGWDKTESIISRLAEIIALNPKVAYLAIGSNDQRSGVTQDSLEARYSRIVTQLEAVGIDVIPLLPFYETSIDQSDTRDFIQSTYSDWIDTWTPMTWTGSLNADGVHPSTVGHRRIAETILNTNIPGGTHLLETIDLSTSSVTPVVPDTPTLQLVTDQGNSTTNAIRISGSGNLPLTGSGLELMTFSGKAWVGGYDRTGGAALDMVLNPGGNTYAGAFLSPTAKLHIGAGTVAAGTAPLKIEGGPVTTTPEAGAIEYNGTRFYGTNGAGTRGHFFAGFDTFFPLGGETSSFPAIKRSGTSLQVRLADDAGFAPVVASQYSASATPNDATPDSVLTLVNGVFSVTDIANISAGGGQPNIQFQDEGVDEGTLGGVTTVDFTGAGVTASEAAGVLTVNIAGGAGSPGGSTTEVQFNDAGSFNGDAGMVYDKTTDALTLAGNAAALGYFLGVDEAVSKSGATILFGRDATFTKTSIYAGSSPMIEVTATNVTTNIPLVVTGDATVSGEAFGVGWNGSDEVPTKNDAYDEIILKAPLASPALTGTPTAPTAAGGTNTTQIATTAFTTAAISGLSSVYQPLDADLTTWAGITPGSNVGTFLATPSSANLRAAVTDESGTGALLFANGALGTPASGDATNLTNIPAGQLTGSVATARLTNIKQVKGVTLTSPTSSENITMFYTTTAITIEEVRTVVLGSSPSITMVINYGSDRSSATGTIVASNTFDSGDSGYATTGFAHTLNTTAIPAGNYVWFTSSATSGTINDLNVNITYSQQ